MLSVKAFFLTLHWLNYLFAFLFNLSQKHLTNKYKCHVHHYENNIAMR